MTKHILYIHGMGGGASSRIPNFLGQHFAAHAPEGFDVEVVVRTYSFDTEIAAAQIKSWVEEVHPDLVIGESLGACQALRIEGMPHIFVSPSLGGPLWLGYLAPLALIPGASAILRKCFPPRPGDRQVLDFRFTILRKYRRHWKTAMRTPQSRVYAFFGDNDNYRKSGVVSIRLWEKYFGKDTYEILSGTHHMSEEHIISRLVPEILRNLVPLPTYVSEDNHIRRN